MVQTIRRRVPFAPSTFFNVILDVASYHLFLPFCVSSKVLTPPSPSPSSPSASTFKAQLTVGFRVFTESYGSLVTYRAPQSISVQATESAIFDHLNSQWRFLPVAGAPRECDVEFTIDFLVTSRMHAGAVQMFFGDVTEQQMKAFVKRCREVEQAKGDRATEDDRGIAQQSQPQALASAATKAAAMDSPPPSVMDSAMHTATTTPPPPQRRQRPAPVSLPSRPAAADAAPLLAQSARTPLYSPPVLFTRRELDALRSLFREYASGGGRKPGTAADVAKAAAEAAPTLSQITEEHTQHRPSSPSPATSSSSAPPSSSYPHMSKGAYVEELSASNAPLALSLPAFTSLCAFLALPTSGVFTKYRERASLRACGEDEAIAHACFASQPSLYRYSGSGVEGDDVTPAFTHSHPLHSHRATAKAGGAAVARSASSTPAGLSFGEFVEVVWGLVRASNGERLHTALMKAARKESAGGRDTLSAERLRSETLAFFALQLGIIRQVMPAMVVRRSRDIDKELGIQRPTAPSSATASDEFRMPSSAPPAAASASGASSGLADPSGRGLYLLAMVGLMESVLSETERALGEAMTLLLHQVHGEGKDAHGGLSVKEWTEWWERQAELLAVMTVPGQSSLIQWASATQTAEHFAEQHQNSNRSRAQRSAT